MGMGGPKKEDYKSFGNYASSRDAFLTSQRKGRDIKQAAKKALKDQEKSLRNEYETKYGKGSSSAMDMYELKVRLGKVQKSLPDRINDFIKDKFNEDR